MFTKQVCVVIKIGAVRLKIMQTDLLKCLSLFEKLVTLSNNKVKQFYFTSF